jgi:hypothetical protein
MHELGSLQPQAGGPSLGPIPAKKPGWALFAGALVCLGLCLAARERLGERANGAASPKQTANGSIERWGKSAVVIEIDDSVREAGPEAVNAVQNAFGNWLTSGATLPSMKFNSSTKKQKPSLLKPDGRNTVSYGAIDIDGHKKDLALTITFLDPATGRIQESDIVINSKYGFLTEQKLPACSGEFDLESVLTHEVGHFFGLGEDTEDDSTTMYYVTRACDIQKRELKEPDRHSMVLLYSTPGDGEDEAATSGGCALAHRTSPSTFWFGALFALMLVARRTRS